MVIGVLALQGGFSAHQKRVNELGHQCVLVRHANELKNLDGLIIPGGESTTLLKLLDENFRARLISAIRGSKERPGLKVLATCAGVILLAKKACNPEQESLGLLDITVERNGYGRQMESFIDPSICWTERGKQVLPRVDDNSSEGVFIRAPKIAAAGSNVEVLATRNDEAVLVRQDNIIGATFHPELSDSDNSIHQLFLDQCACDN